jgi:hypothetical protein
MCTLSFWPMAGGYLLLHSRDERRTRAAAEGPRRLGGARVATIAPRDGEALGTWIALDAEGRALCVLNGPESGAPHVAVPRSRGLLAAELARDLRRTACFEALQRELDRGVYQPVLLAHVERDGSRGAGTLALWRWNGRALTDERHSARHLEVSSGLDLDAATQRRGQRFAEISAALDDAGPRPVRRALWAFHHEHRAEAPEGDGSTPCMHRAEASTRGLSLVDVRGERAALLYRSGSPCERAPIEVHRAPRASTDRSGDWTSHRPAR